MIFVNTEDYNANEFLVEKGLSKDRAEQLAQEYIERGHHQHYWVDKQPSEGTDFVALLSGMLQAGSTLRMSAQVLLAQGATEDECLDALAACSTNSIEECKKLLAELNDESSGT